MKKVILLILDGWGYRESSEHNAIKLSNPKNFNRLLETSSYTLINASEEFVGLPKGQMGNSEVGHTNIGAGRIVYQDFLKINMDVDSGKINNNENILRFVETLKSKNKNLHFFGLLSDGGVHSHINHLKSLLRIAKIVGVKDSFIHAFMDGRDTPPTNGINYIKDIESFCKKINYGHIVTVMGRYYAMDRDKRWDRVKLAYDAISGIADIKFDDPSAYIESSYLNGTTDEFIFPAKKIDFNGIEDGDGIFFYNFRADRARQLVNAFTDRAFSEFKRDKFISSPLMTMTEYNKNYTFPVAYPNEELKDVMGEVISKNGLNQLRIAETEKYAHVTFFFNGGREIEFENEKRILVQSPKDVPTYDLKPEMSVREVCDRFVETFTSQNVDFTVMNFANPDMVGHTGVEDAAIKACSAVDEQLGRVIKIAEETGAVLIVTADHGNSEQMWDYDNNQPHTAHTPNPVYFIVHNYPCRLKKEGGKLADISPTILSIMGIQKPASMTGETLITE